MTNDKDIEVLIRRYAQSAAKGTPVEHPDADELNAFAEGQLPAAARQQYVSHFADCDDCRKIVSQLAITAGAGVEAQIPASEAVAEPWWRKLGLLFAPATLRYAAFAVVLVAVVGIAYLVWRRPAQRNASLIAQNQPQASSAESIEPGKLKGQEFTRDSAETKAVPQATVPALDDQRQPDSTMSAAPPPPKPADVLAAKEPAPVAAGAARADDAPRPESSPSYAPAPATEKFGYGRAREQQSVSPSPGGPRRNESDDKYKAIDRARSGEAGKDRDENQARIAASQPVTKQEKESELTRGQTSLGVLTTRNRSEAPREARKSAAVADSAEEAPETRSVGGRKFKRQGKAWVDSKFKSSMSVRSVARGSEDFAKLDSGLRSIANQLSGEIVVVWKRKAYRIQ